MGAWEPYFPTRLVGSACSTDLSLGSFSRILIKALFAENCSILPLAANIDRGTTENSYTPTASLMSISGLNLQITIIRAKRHQSSFSSMILSFVATLTVFAVVFHVRSLRFFTSSQMLFSAVCIRSLTNVWNSLLPMTL